MVAEREEAAEALKAAGEAQGRRLSEAQAVIARLQAEAQHSAEQIAAATRSAEGAAARCAAAGQEVAALQGELRAGGPLHRGGGA